MINGERQADRQLVLPVQVVYRASCGCAPAPAPELRAPLRRPAE